MGSILRAAIGAGHPWVATTILVLLAVIFVGMAQLILGMSLGAPESAAARARESRWLVFGPVALAGAVLLLGVYVPGPLQSALARAAVALGGQAP